MTDRIFRYIAVAAYLALALWLIIGVGGWWIVLGAFLLLGLLHPRTWRNLQ